MERRARAAAHASRREPAQPAGQWALPGGRIDEGETPEQAALRELSEEVGLMLEASAVLGRLDDYATRSGYLITPVVVWAGAALEVQPNAGEVASIHRIPAGELLREDAPMAAVEEYVKDQAAQSELVEGFEASDPTEPLVAERDRIERAMEELGESDLPDAVLRDPDACAARAVRMVRARDAGNRLARAPLFPGLAGPLENGMGVAAMERRAAKKL